MAKPIVILGIETSCDDTCVAISKNNKIIANVIYSSTPQHVKWGGIVPEIAARSHEQALLKVYLQALKQARLSNKSITHVCYTSNPGLPGSLHVGKVFAKALATLLNVKLIPIDHLLGHVFSFHVNTNDKIKFPLLACVLSGGHTCIYLFKSINKYIIVNQTQDDAIGEALDKVGRVLGIKYPGGVNIDKNYTASKHINIINHYEPTAVFSFSGAKTHVTNIVNSLKMKKQKIDKYIIGSSFLKWCVDEISIKMNYYVNKYKPQTIVFGGGVSANQLLRKQFTSIKCFFPGKEYCTDNAAMICHYCYLVNTKK
jgi:N6-L-threonylcarbamoyladenine synthase